MLDGRGRNDKPTQLRVAKPPRLSIDEMMRGQPVAAAEGILLQHASYTNAPLLLAARRVFDLPVTPAMQDDMRQEILRDHVLKLWITLPTHFGLAGAPLPPREGAGDHIVAEALFGPAGAPPPTPDAYERFLQSDRRMGALLRKIDRCFEAGEAATGKLDPFTSSSGLVAAPLENSLAQRHLLHPVMRHIAETRGRGPLWRTTARIYDAYACLRDRLPLAHAPAAHRVCVPVSQGSCLIEARAQAGRIARFRIVAPDDHLLANGGILDRMFDTLPAIKEGLVPLLLDIVDPSVALEVVPGHGT